MKILVIGYGSIGKRHISNLKNLGVDNILAQDADKQRYAEVRKKFGLKVYEKLSDCFQTHIDVAVIAVPNSLHVPVAIECAKHKCHLFIEKPLSHNLDDLEELEHLITQYSLKVMVGYNWRYHPSFLKMKKIIDSGILGKIFGTRVVSGQYLPDWHPGEDYRKNYSARKDLGGGILNDAHELDYITWLLGDIKRATCYFGKVSSLEIETEDVASILLEFETGAIANIHVDYLQRSYNRSYEIYGEEGSLFWNYNDDIVKYYNSKTDSWKFFSNRNFNFNETYLNELADFINGIQRGAQFSGCSFQEGIRLVKIVSDFKNNDRGIYEQTRL